MDNESIGLESVRNVPAYAEPIIRAIGLSAINWGKMEQHLEILLHHLDNPRFGIGPVPVFPTTSFRLKVQLFEDWYTHHPKLAPFHEFARGVYKGLRKAGKSRINVIHSNVQRFDLGPPATVTVTIVKFNGRKVRTLSGVWEAKHIEDFNELLCIINDDLFQLTRIVMTPDFRRSLEKDLSRIQKAKLAARRFLLQLRRRYTRTSEPLG